MRYLYYLLKSTNKVFQHVETLFVQGKTLYLGQIKFLHVKRPYTKTRYKARGTKRKIKRKQTAMNNIIQFASEININ